MEEENGKQEPAEQKELLAGKFKSVDALVRAYGELEAEFTRRSQRLKALESEERKGEDAHPVMDGDGLFEAVKGNEEVRSRIVSEYLRSLKGVPLLSSSGAGVTAPVKKPSSIREAGKLALGYIRQQQNKQ